MAATNTSKLASDDQQLYVENDLRPYHERANGWCGRKGIILAIVFGSILIAATVLGVGLMDESSDDSTSADSAVAAPPETLQAGTASKYSMIMPDDITDDNDEDMLNEYIAAFSKEYEDDVERAYRKQIFLENNAKYAEMNAKRTQETDATFGWTIFTDRTTEEFRKMNGFKRNTMINPYAQIEVDELPEDIIGRDKGPTDFTDLVGVDWRQHGKTTTVKDQAYCGSCWAFSAVETVESAMLMAETPEAGTKLSEQQVVSCDPWDWGCDGGTTGGALHYIQEAGGLESNEDYFYWSGTACCIDDSLQCEYDAAKDVPDSVPIDFKYATSPCFTGECSGQNERQLAISLMNRGPLAICLDACYWSGYTGGIMTPSLCGDFSSAAFSVDHCVQLVGMELDPDNPYWIVRNSWGWYWGADGFIYLSMGQNTCGVANEAMWVEVVPTGDNPAGATASPVMDPTAILDELAVDLDAEIEAAK